MIGGIPITKKQRYLAGRTDLVALLRSRGETLKKLGSEWEWKFHDERVTIRNNVWFNAATPWTSSATSTGSPRNRQRPCC